MNLYLENHMTWAMHKGAVEVQPEDITVLPAPRRLGTQHYPMHFKDFYSEVRDKLITHNVTVDKERHALWTAPNADIPTRWFCLLNVMLRGLATEGYSLMIALRGSWDQAFADSVGAGSNVFICDNLALMAEIMEKHKNTRFMHRQFPARISRALNQLDTRALEQDTAFRRYRITPVCNRAEADNLIMECYRNGVFPASKIADVEKHWTKPEYEDFKEQNVWSFFNAVTSSIPDQIVTQPHRTRSLHRVVNQYCGLAA